MDKNGKAGEQHFLACGVANAGDYLQWCRDHHFRPTTAKSDLQLERERNFARKTAAKQALSSGKDRPVRTVVGMLRSGARGPIGVRNGSPQAAVVESFQRANAVSLAQGSAFLDLVEQLDRASKLTRTVDGVVLLGALAGCREAWIREPVDWRPRSRSPRRQLAELARHLLCRFPVPAFLDRVWFDAEQERFRPWFIHIGQGGRLPDLPDQPVVMTKRLGHHFLRAPRDFTIMEAIRFGQIAMMGGPLTLASAIRSTQLTELHEHTVDQDDFVRSVLRFFADHPTLGRGDIQAIIDFVWARKFGFLSPFEFDARGQQVTLPPSQPNLSMQGRTPQALLRQIAEWHRELSQGDWFDKYRWAHRPDIADASYRSPARNASNASAAGNAAERRTWRIVEQLTGRQLAEEGRAMGHCVYAYTEMCAKGRASIWSMTVEQYDSVDRRLTIEVRAHNIVQAKGRYNRYPSENEAAVLRRWARDQGLHIRANVL